MVMESKKFLFHAPIQRSPDWQSKRPIILMVRGYKAEEQIVKSLEEKHGIPIVTTGMNHMKPEGTRGEKDGGNNVLSGRAYKTFGRYFNDAGFEVLEMEGFSVPFAQAGRVSPHDVYAFAKQQYLRHKNTTSDIHAGWMVAGP